MSVRTFARIAPLGLAILSGCGGFTEFRGVLEMNGEAMTMTGMPPYALGKHELAKGRLGLAVTAFNQALAAEPNSVPVLNALAAAYDRMGRFDLADRYYARALEAAPDDAQTLNNAGYSRYLRGDLAEAVRLLELAQRQEWSNPVIAANLTFAHTALAAANPAPAAAVAATDAEAEPAPRPRMIVERTGPGLHTLALASADFLAAARKAGVEPKLAAVHGAVRRPAERRPFPIGEKIDLAALEKVATPPARPDPEPAARPVTCRLEVSNGAGRARMATRMRGHLRGAGLDVGCLTNAAGFDHERSVVYHRPGFEAQARALAARLPVPVAVEAAPDQTNDLRLLLGRDLLPFDRQLLQRETAHEA